MKIHQMPILSERSGDLPAHGLRLADHGALYEFLHAKYLGSAAALPVAAGERPLAKPALRLITGTRGVDSGRAASEGKARELKEYAAYTQEFVA